MVLTFQARDSRIRPVNANLPKGENAWLHLFFVPGADCHSPEFEFAACCQSLACKQHAHL